MQDIQSIMLKQFMKGCRPGNVLVITACLANSNFDPKELTDPERSDWRGSIMSTGFIEGCFNGHTKIVRLLLNDSRIEITIE